MYQRTCHVYGQTRHYKEREERKKKGRKRRGVPAHLSRLWTDTPVQEGHRERRKRKQTEEGEIVQVHLSRLWTDTQVRRERNGGRNDGVTQLS